MNEFKTLKELDDYILKRINHETDIIMESEWFEEQVEKAIKAYFKKQGKEVTEL